MLPAHIHHGRNRNAAANGLSTSALLQVLVGGPTAAQIAAGSLLASNGQAITCSRGGSKFCSTGAVQDPAQLLVDPELVGSANWTLTSITATTNNAAAPDGTTTASLLTSSAAGAAFNGTSVTAAAAQYGASIYLKGSVGQTLTLAVYDSTGASNVATVTCNLTGSWQRFYCNGTTTAGHIIYLKVSNSSGWSSGNVYAWGAKLAKENADSSYTFGTHNNQAYVLLGSNQIAVEPKGILVERGTTNWLLQSQALATTPWANNGTATMANNVGIAPDGTQTASSVTITSGTAAGESVSQNISSMTSNATYVFSAWLWVPSGTASVRISRTNTSSWTTATVSPTLTLTTTPTRYSLTFTTGAAETSSGLVIGSENLTPFHCTFGVPIYVWGAQVEASFMSSYIKTTTVTAARASDTINYPTVNLGSAQGSVKINYTPEFNGSANKGGPLLQIPTNELIYSNGGETTADNYDGTFISVNANYTAGVTRTYGFTWNSAGRTITNFTDNLSATGSVWAPAGAPFSTMTINTNDGSGVDGWVSDIIFASK